jgi:hypothetical protein
MELMKEIQAEKNHPGGLEKLYQDSIQEGKTEAFRSALLTCFEKTPDNLLFAAWFYRLQQEKEAIEKPRRVINWWLAVPLSILTGLIFWALSDFDSLMFLDHLPYLLLWWSPIATISALVFITVTTRKNQVRAVILGLSLFVLSVYILLLTPGLNESWKVNHYLDLGAIHLPLLCWIALGISVLGLKSTTENRFAFLIKSIEVIITAGLYLIAGVALGGITIGMFEALNISLPDIWLRLIAFGGFGLIPVMALASVFDPSLSPSEQDFNQGLSKFIATMMRLLLPLTLVVLVVYLFVIPFKFMEPFKNREVLIVYNLMLFAIMGLLLGATPIHSNDLSRVLKKWLRIGIILVASLTVLISLYALSATVYRTIEGGWTINRLTIIGWNFINISILSWMIFTQIKIESDKWIESMQSVFSLATTAYLVWGLMLIIFVPILFR